MIVCTITPPADCLARLAACPALPRGERLEWAMNATKHVPWMHIKAINHVVECSDEFADLWEKVVNVTDPDDKRLSIRRRVQLWRSMARPLRVARERLREARTALATERVCCCHKSQRGYDEHCECCGRDVP